MTTEDAKAYLASREIPQLFESLMTGLMFYRPDDHIGYLEECLRKIREEGVDKVRWNLFITSSQSKMPLPPITPDGRPRSQQGNKEKSFITEVPKSLDEARGTPLPAIGQTTVTVPVKGQIDLPNCPIILAMGGPGSGKATQAAKLVARYEGYVHLSMGDLLRQRILDKGSSNDKWGALGQIMSQGDLAPDDMTTDLIAEQVKANMNAKGLIFEGYPRTTEQLQEFLNLVGRVDLAFILDCEEQYLMQRILARGKDEGKADDNASAAAQRLLFFKDKTLPVIKALDDMGKLAVLDGDRDADEIFFNLAQVVDNVFYSGATTGGQTPRTTSTSQKTANNQVPHPPTSPRPASGGGRRSRPASRVGSGFTRVPTLLDINEPDTGRKSEMPQCPVITIMSGPGCRRNELTNILASEVRGAIHLSLGDLLRSKISSNTGNSRWDKLRDVVNSGELADMDTVAEVVEEAMQRNASASAILIDGFPRNKEQLELFNKKIGGLTMAILLDCDEVMMRKVLEEKGGNREDGTPAAITARLNTYKHQTLPVLGHLDDIGKLTVVNVAQNDAEVMEELKHIYNRYTRNTDSSMLAARPPSARVDPPDTGRKQGLIACPFFGIVGAPSIGVEQYASKVAAKLPNFAMIDMSDGKTVQDLKLAITQHIMAEGVILVNYPLNQQNAYDFHKEIGGLDLIVVLDCAEEVAAKGANPDQLKEYKMCTIPLLGYYDDRRRLEVVTLADSISEDEVVQEVIKHVEVYKEKPRVSGDITEDDLQNVGSVVNVPDTGRKTGLPGCPVVSIIGAAGSGVDEVAQKLADAFPGTQLVDASNLEADELVGKLSADTKALLLKGYPESAGQVDDFNTKIGGMTGVLVIDATEGLCKQNGGEETQIQMFTNNTIPVLGYFDDIRKLDVIPADRPIDEVFSDAQKALEVLLNKGSSSSA